MTKSILKISFNWAVLLLILWGLSGCQEEVVEIVDPPADQVIQSSSAVKDLVQRTSSKDGSDDNIIDRSSCISVVYPVTVVIDGIEIVVESEDDLDELEDLLEASGDDDVDIIFPVTVILPDYTEIIIRSEDELDALTDDCEEGGFDDDIECLDFVYPITVSVYDANNQLASVITVQNDEQLYILFDDLEDDEFLSFSFPIQVILWDGRQLEVTTNDQLEQLIRDVEDDCDEDDDNDFDDDDIDDSEFVGVVTSGNWTIEKLTDEEDDFAVFLAGYRMNFNQNGQVVLTGRDPSVSGEWETSGNSGMIKLDIDLETENFPDDLEQALDALDDTWNVISYSDSQIELQEDTDDDDPSILILTK